MEKQKIKEVVFEAIDKLFETKIDLNETFNERGVDSLDRLQLLIEVERQLDTEISDSVLDPTNLTVEVLIDLIHKDING